MHLEVLIGAVAKKLRAARPEVGESGDVLSGVEVVVWWRWIVDMRGPFLGGVTLRCVTASSKISV
jgi:hypothetical protein